MLPRDADRPDHTSEPEPTVPIARPVAPTHLPFAGGPSTSRANPAAAAPPGLSPLPNALSLLRAFRRRWLLASSVAVLAAVTVGAAAYLTMPQSYVAFATVQIAASPDIIGKAGWRPDLNTVMKTQATRFKGRDILLKALGQEKVRNLNLVKRHPSTLGVLTWLEENLKIETQDNNELMSVSLSGDEPEELVVMVDALTGSYLSIINGKEQRERGEKVKKMQAMADKIKGELATKLSELQAMSQGQGSLDPSQWLMQQQMKLGQLSRAQDQLLVAHHDLDKIKARLMLLKTSKKVPTIDDVPDHYITQMIQTDSLIQPKMQTIGKLENTMNMLMIAGHSALDPSLRGVREKLAKLRKEVDRHRDTMRAEVFSRYREKVANEYKLAMDALEAELHPVEAVVKKAQARVEQLAQETEGFGLSNSAKEAKKAEIASLEKQQVEVERSLLSVQMEQVSEMRVQGCQDAVWQVSNGRKRTMILLALPCLALAAGLLGVSYWEFRARRIHSTDEVAVGLGMRVVGAVPALAHAAQKQFSGADDAPYDHHLVESVDALRTMLLRHAGTDGAQVVMVTSAVAGEGKTTLASNLALSLARAGRRTLLIDCDLRRPALHQLFEQTLQPGLSEAILNEVELSDAVRPTTTDEHLWLMPAGQWDREVIQELARETTRTLFERLRDEFDFVVIDSHPVLPATDSLLIGQHADAVLVSVLHGVSKAPRVYAAHQRLATLGIRVFGAVVNGVPTDTCETGSHYQYTAPAAA